MTLLKQLFHRQVAKHAKILSIKNLCISWPTRHGRQGIRTKILSPQRRRERKGNKYFNTLCALYAPQPAYLGRQGNKNLFTAKTQRTQRLINYSLRPLRLCGEIFPRPLCKTDVTSLIFSTRNTSPPSSFSISRGSTSSSVAAGGRLNITRGRKTGPAPPRSCTASITSRAVSNPVHLPIGPEIAFCRYT